MPRPNVGGRPRSDVRGGLVRLIGEVAIDTSSAPRFRTDIAARLGIDASTLNRHERRDEEVRRYVEQLLTVGRTPSAPIEEGVPVAATAVDPEELSPWDGLPDDELAARARRHVKAAGAAMARFAQRSERRYSHPSDLPQTVFQLQRSVQEASAALASLKVLTEEWLRRSAESQIPESARDPDLFDRGAATR